MPKAGPIQLLIILSVTVVLLLNGTILFSKSKDQNGDFFIAQIDGPIGPSVLAKVRYGLKQAQQKNAGALILQLDTPGGLLATTKQLVMLFSQSPVPIIVYVGPSGASATSAGAFLVLAAHYSVMNTGTHIGASTPISETGEDISGTLGKKIVNDTRAFIRSIAEQHNRNVKIADEFVAKTLSLTAHEALKENIINLVINHPESLLERLHNAQINFKQTKITLDTHSKNLVFISTRWTDRAFELLTDPNVVRVLLTIGIAGVLIEFLTPGLLFPGLLGAIALLLILPILQNLPINWGSLFFVFLGFGLLISEIFVTTFGILGLAGIAALTLGTLDLFTDPYLKPDSSLILTFSIGTGLSVLFISLLISKHRWFKTVDSNSPKFGEAVLDFDNQGYVDFKGKRWKASTTKRLERGDIVKILETTGDMVLIVEKADPSMKKDN